MQVLHTGLLVRLNMVIFTARIESILSRSLQKYYRNEAQRIVYIHTYLNCISSHITYR